MIKFNILPLYAEEEKEEEIEAYICTPDFTEASYLWRISPPNKGALFPPKVNLFYACRVKPGSSSTKTKELIGSQEKVRANIA